MSGTRGLVRIAVLCGGVGAAVLLLLLLVTMLTASPSLAVLTGILGILLLAGVCAATLALAGRLSRSTDHLATRTKNLETRTADLAIRAEDAETRVDDLGARLRRSRREVDAARVRIDALETPVRRLRDQQKRAAQRGDQLEADSARLDAKIRAVSADHTAALAALRGTLDEQQQAHRSAVAETRRVHRDVQVLRRRVPAGFLEPIRSRLGGLEDASRETLRSSFESAIQLGRDPRTSLSIDQARLLFADYLDRGEMLQLRPLIESFGLLAEQNLTVLRSLYRYYRAAGYWDLAALAVDQVAAATGSPGDARATEKIGHEIELFSQPTKSYRIPVAEDAHDPAGPILHVVGRVLPDTQTGYTLRTQYTAEAQARKGLPVAIVGQPGITDDVAEEVRHYVHRGIDYYLLPGPPRNEVLVDEWLQASIDGLAALVAQIRPSILHAQSDFFNALIVEAVGRACGIPTVYESRGFWEESWLSRTVTANGWADPASLFGMYGRPAAYDLRRRAEEVSRLLSGHVFTLAEVMREHILDSAHGALERSAVSIVPNAVQPSSFPVQEADADLAREIGIPAGSLVVGYISSMVEYEGIDTLLEAYHLAARITEAPLCLLLVGDGDHLPVLREQVRERGIEGVIFTGRVPHEDVLRYYGLIDLFVVPRKASTVSDLVTPLKPFEAFSTGRTVILSDVGALQEIARQSQAVETFVAGDAGDLASTMVSLLEDPERRRELGRRAARWVRNHRTWDSNVAAYHRVYRSLGYTGPSSQSLESDLCLRERGINPGDILDALAHLEEPPLTGWFSLEEMSQSAQDIVGTGWVYAEFEPVRVTEHPDWAACGRRHRTWGFNLHSWKFLEPLLREHESTGDRSWLETALDIALDWTGTYLGPDSPEDPMAWYDMSLALRAPMLLSLVVRTAPHEDLRAEGAILIEALLRHMEALREEAAFNSRNNHGFYTAASQLHLAKHGALMPGSAEQHDQGRERLRIMLTRQFAPDGMHLEHSSDYHRMLLASFQSAIEDDLVEDPAIHERIGFASGALGWMIQPDGHLVQFGDSPATRMLVIEPPHALDPSTRFILTDGRQGEAPTEELAVYREGGYAFVRSPAPQAPGDLAASSYLAFSAAFHSRAHKHADDLNVVWYDRGAEILVDAGRFGYGDLLAADDPLRRKGYYYGSPQRQYVEGTMAHNTLMMDGQDQERRGREPYGSGIVDAVQEDGVFDISGRVHHADYIHRRRVVLTPGRELRVKDAVFSQSAEERSAVVWFNIDGAFELEEQGDSLRFVRETSEGPLTLDIFGPGTLVEPVRGQEKPLRGWRSRQDRFLEPVWSVGFTVPVETRASVETRLLLS